MSLWLLGDESGQPVCLTESGRIAGLWRDKVGSMVLIRSEEAGDHVSLPVLHQFNGRWLMALPLEGQYAGLLGKLMS